jgi:hypothetical protein
MAYERGEKNNIIVGAAALFIKANGPVDPTEATGEMPDFDDTASYKDTLSGAGSLAWRNVGYTQNGMEITITPDFGEVEVDQLLDSAKIFKQGMQVTLNTTFAEATLENLLYAIAAAPRDLNGGLVGIDFDDVVGAGLPDTYSGIRNERFESDPVGSAQGVLINEEPDGTTSVTGQNPERNPAAPGGGHWTPGSSVVTNDILEINSGNLGECPIERALCAVGPGTGVCEASEEVERIYVAFRALSMDAVTISVTRDSASTFDVNFRLLPAGNGSYGRIIDRTFVPSTVRSAAAGFQGVIG